MRKAIISLLCVITLLFGGVVYADDSISISQSIDIDVYNGWDTKEFTYTLTPEEPSTNNAEKGVEGGCVLQTDTLNFSSADGNQQTKSILIDVDTEKFDHAGNYQYRLTNVTQNDYRILEVVILNEGGNLTLSSYCFFDATGKKDVGFSYMEALIPPAVVGHQITFRFVTDNGDVIGDDIVFIETEYSSDGEPPLPEEPVIEEPAVEAPVQKPQMKPLVATNDTTNGAVVMKLSARREPVLAFAPVEATGVDDAYSMYEVTLQGLLDSGYTVVKDEVAEHGKTGVWAKNGNDTVYLITMHSPSAATFRVKIVKMSNGQVKYALKGAEFTLFDMDGNIVNDVNGNPCVGLTDEDGNLEFRILNDGGTYYIQETKAPSGYELNPDKFYVTPDVEGATNEGDNTIVVPIKVFDNPLFIFPPTPKTGDNFPMVILVVLAIAGVAGLTTTIIMVKNRKRGRED